MKAFDALIDAIEVFADKSVVRGFPFIGKKPTGAKYVYKNPDVMEIIIPASGSDDEADPKQVIRLSGSDISVKIGNSKVSPMKELELYRLYDPRVFYKIIDRAKKTAIYENPSGSGVLATYEIWFDIFDLPLDINEFLMEAKSDLLQTVRSRLSKGFTDIPEKSREEIYSIVGKSTERWLSLATRPRSIKFHVDVELNSRINSIEEPEIIPLKEADQDHNTVRVEFKYE